MIEEGSLHMIFNEEIFLVNEENQTQKEEQQIVAADTSESTLTEVRESSSPGGTSITNQEVETHDVTEKSKSVEEPEKAKPAAAQEIRKTTAAPQSESTTKSDQLFIATEVLNDAGNELVSKITSAVGLTKNDYKISIGSSAGIPQHKKAIIFTRNPKMPLYEVSNFKGTQLLVSKSLEELEHSRDEKLKLWNALKEWYGV